MTLSIAKLKEIAAAIGLTQVGVTGPEVVDGLFETLENRQNEDRTSPFEEKDLLKRIQPGAILKGCQSVIVLAVPYRPKPHRAPPGQANTPRGLVASCARGLDYHILARTKAEALLSSVNDQTCSSGPSLIQCDRGPLVERALAVRAGLGIYGSNSTLINQEYGSYTALALIMTGVKIEQNSTALKKCFECGKCLKECPTGAIIRPGIIDYRRCLSYLSQAPGNFPHVYRSLLGRRIYGCDSCQDCCPHNEAAAYSPFPEASFELFPGEPDLLTLLQMTRKEYDLTIGLTSAGWRGKTTLQRNAVIAAGNTENGQLIKPLLRLLENDSRPVIRAHAAWSLGQSGGQNAARGIEKALAKDPEESVRFEAKRALEAITF